jgi:hypothetical protein
VRIARKKLLAKAADTVLRARVRLRNALHTGDASQIETARQDVEAATKLEDELRDEIVRRQS